MITELVDLAFPAICLSCGEKPKPLCENCLPAFGTQQDEEGVFFAAELDDSLLAIVSALKDKNRTAMVRPLGLGVRSALGAAISFIQPDLIVCPPSSKKNFRKRGFNPAKAIFRFANQSNLVCSDRALRLLYQPIDQRSLGALQRTENTLGRYRSLVSNRRVLLVDDVMTTGATLAAASVALEQAGCEVVGKCVVARRFSISSHGNLK